MAAVSLAGCAARAPAPPLPPAVEPAAVLAALDARRAAVRSLRARTRLRAGLAGAWTRQAVLVRRPDAVRVDVFSPFGLALALGVQGPVLWAYPPAEATRYEGEATPGNLTRLLGAPLEVGDLVDVLLGVPPRRVPVAPVGLAGTEDGRYRLRVPLRHGLQTLWVAATTGHVMRAEESVGDQVVLRVDFGDYRGGFPHRLRIEVPAHDTAVTLAYQQVEENAFVDPVLFVPPRAPRVLPLEAAAH